MTECSGRQTARWREAADAGAVRSAVSERGRHRTDEALVGYADGPTDTAHAQAPGVGVPGRARDIRHNARSTLVLSRRKARRSGSHADSHVPITPPQVVDTSAAPCLSTVDRPPTVDHRIERTDGDPVQEISVRGTVLG